MARKTWGRKAGALDWAPDHPEGDRNTGITLEKHKGRETGDDTVIALERLWLRRGVGGARYENTELALE